MLSLCPRLRIPPILVGFLFWGCSLLLLEAQVSPEREELSELGQEDIPVTAKEAIEEGNEAFKRGDYLQAKGSYEVARKVIPNNLMLLVNLGLTEFYLGQLEDAEASLLRAIQQRIDLPAAWQVLGLIHLDSRRYEQAMAAFAQVVVREPRNARARNYLGVAIGQMGWFDGAESEFRKAIEFDPKYADAHFNLAYFCLQRRNPAIELARRHYAKAVELGADRDPELEKQFSAPPRQ